MARSDRTSLVAREERGLLGMKNTVVTEWEARSMVEQCGRLVKWAAAVVAAHLD